MYRYSTQYASDRGLALAAARHIASPKRSQGRGLTVIKQFPGFFGARIDGAQGYLYHGLRFRVAVGHMIGLSSFPNIGSTMDRGGPSQAESLRTPAGRELKHATASWRRRRGPYSCPQWWGPATHGTSPATSSPLASVD